MQNKYLGYLGMARPSVAQRLKVHIPKVHIPYIDPMGMVKPPTGRDTK